MIAPDQEPISSTTDEGPVTDDGPMEAIKRLIDEAQAAAASESALLKLCGAVVLSAIKAMSAWGVVALFCGFVGLLTFAVGAVIAVAQWTGAVLAVVIVPGILFAIAGLAAWRVQAHVGKMRDAVAKLRP